MRRSHMGQSSSISETERGFSKERKWDVLCESTLSLRHKYETKSSSLCSDHRNRDQSLDSRAYCRTKDVFCLPSSFSLAPDRCRSERAARHGTEARVRAARDRSVKHRERRLTNDSVDI